MNKISRFLPWVALVLGFPFFYLSIANALLHAMKLALDCSLMGCTAAPMLSDFYMLILKISFSSTMFLSFSHYSFQPVIPYYLALLIVLGVIIKRRFKPEKSTLIIGTCLLLPALAYGIDRLIFLPKMISQTPAPAPVPERLEVFDCKDGYQITLVKKTEIHSIVRYSREVEGKKKGFPVGLLIKTDLKVIPYNWSGDHKKMFENIVKADACKNEKGDSLSTRIDPIKIPEFDPSHSPAPDL